MENPENPNDLADEFRLLGENLVNTLRTFWESPERKKLHDEIEAGLNELAATIKGEASTFRESSTGQRLKADFEDIGKRMRSGEAEEKARQELLKALKLVNTELEKASTHWRERDSGGGDQGTPS